MDRKNRIFTGNRQNQKQRILFISVATATGFGIMLYLIFFMSGNLAFTKKTQADPGSMGNNTISSGTTMVNEYTNLTADVIATATQITVANNTLNDNNRFSDNLEAGDLIMIIQMRGATINETNASTYGSVSSYGYCGKYEFVEVLGTTGVDKIDLAAGLSKSYTASGNVQVLRVPRYQNFTIDNGATVTCPPWNGTTGGIVAIEANNTMTINGTVDASAKGFRGGVVEQSSDFPGDHSIWRSTSAGKGSEKGESISGYQSGYTQGRYGRGAPANGGGGGNSHNSPGGGGSNGNNGVTWNGKGNPDNSVGTYTTAWNKEASGFSGNTSSGGGRGGYSFAFANLSPTFFGPNSVLWGGDFRYNVGGYGGRPLDYSTGSIFMGGGGGAGDSNSGKGTDGGDGGGIIFLISANDITGSGTLKANGEDAAGVSGTSWLDAPGGGGGGGAIIVYSLSGNTTSLSIEAKGGKGGDWTNTSATNETSGGGGGGGGGYICITNPTGLTQSVNGGNNGENKNAIISNFKPNGATKGAAGQLATNPPNPYSGSVSLPVELTSFTGKIINTKAQLNWTTASEKNNNFFTISRSNDGVNYVQLAQVQGRGTSTIKMEYGYLDNTPVKGINYYRLKQTDMNGSSKNFQPIAVEIGNMGKNNSSEIAAYPNPFKDLFTLKVYCKEEKGNAQLKLSDKQGRLVQFQEVKLVEGPNFFIFNALTAIPQGIYLLSVKQNDGSSSNLKVVKN